jgi:hypothetical protein
MTICLVFLFWTIAASFVQAQDSGKWVSLFDGKSLEGWTDQNDAYRVQDGLLVCKEGGTGNLLSEREYSDFVLCFEFKLPPGGNNGVAIRAPETGVPAYTGMEIQILDDGHEKYKDLKEYQYHGSVYGVAPAKRGCLNPTGKWNKETIRVVGRRVTVWLNGKRILDVDLDNAAPGGKTIDDEEHPGLARTNGHIGFMAHSDPVAFRNICLREVCPR